MIDAAAESDHPFGSETTDERLADKQTNISRAAVGLKIFSVLKRARGADRDLGGGANETRVVENSDRDILIRRKPAIEENEVAQLRIQVLDGWIAPQFGDRQKAVVDQLKIAIDVARDCRGQISGDILDLIADVAAGIVHDETKDKTDRQQSNRQDAHQQSTRGDALA
ncbi:hypothetical protein [Lichenihabitans sp. PAMC28606]|uniref:hypothetical protein n=1 Tax=Lichenihabitans sp. PAMC28606 TaxID=2880932 RepID=UPI0039B3FB7B